MEIIVYLKGGIVRGVNAESFFINRNGITIDLASGGKLDLNANNIKSIDVSGKTVYTSSEDYKDIFKRVLGEVNTITNDNEDKFVKQYIKKELEAAGYSLVTFGKNQNNEVICYFQYYGKPLSYKMYTLKIPVSMDYDYIIRACEIVENALGEHYDSTVSSESVDSKLCRIVKNALENAGYISPDFYTAGNDRKVTCKYRIGPGHFLSHCDIYMYCKD